MNEQMQVALLEMIKKANSGIDASISFLSSEIPDVIHQLLMWYAIKGAIYCIGAVALLVAWFFIERLAIKKIKASRADMHEVLFFYGFLGCFPRLVPAIFAASMINLDWLQIMIAPKIWLIEYAASLAK